MGKKVVISGYYGFKNFGDELILSILCKYLKERDVDITVFSSDPPYTSFVHEVHAVPSFDIPSVIKVLRECDTLISGGGSLFQDATSLKSLIYYAFILAVAQFFGKKTIVFAQGVGPLKSPISRFLVKWLFSGADNVSVRDEKSLSMLDAWGIEAELVDDPVYSLELAQTLKEDITGIQLRAFEGISPEFLLRLKTALGDRKLRAFSLQKSLDYEICNDFCDDVVEERIVREISKCDTLVAMRFHALIVALKAGVKCVAINYDPKIQTLAEKYSIPLIEFDDDADTMQAKINEASKVDIPIGEISVDF